MNVRSLLDRMVELDASDLHLKVGSPPGLRVHGELRPVEGWDRLDASTCRGLIFEILEEDQIEIFDRDRDLDLSVSIEGLSRFRVNVFHQRGSCAAVLRRIPLDVPNLDEMDYPAIVRDLCDRGHGLTLVTGPTGSGKSTTLAAMVDYINRNKHGHILTLEDPIEYVHPHKGCVLMQREIGVDTESWDIALKNSLRQAPDVILIGEVRTAKTMQQALTFAETGHLCLCTLHANNANQALDRIQSFFPADMHHQVWMDLSLNLKSMVAQQAGDQEWAVGVARGRH